MSGKRHILIGITGSVAAIKVPEIIDGLIELVNKNQNSVLIKVVRTITAKEYFFGFDSCDKFEVVDDILPERAYNRSDPILHIELRRWADIFVICPLDANTLAKISNGLCDSLLTDIARSWDMRKPFLVYPCMNTFMYEHQITDKQISILQSFGIKVVPPIAKLLACGDYVYYLNMGGQSSKVDEKLRENKRQINRTIRELDRQRMAAEREEQVTISKLKNEAKMGRTKNVKIMAKDIVRNRKLASHYYHMKSQMVGILSQLQSAHSTNMLAANLKNVNKLMAQVSSKTNAVEFQKIMQGINRESEILNLKMDMMSEAVDDSLMGITPLYVVHFIITDPEGTEEEELIVSQILEELGIDATATLNTATCPVSSSGVKGMAHIEIEGHGQKYTNADDTLEDRINNLKK
ncbi:flavoprotein domain containing protein [Theileria equi strain WA]|uniref:Flavoprotein domain containing protein n=1 Tax=Theileria equi strain WA TaxID=1537102 RepID=L0AWK8_THEEQ|nr:flavoprotein domain containing protein [Theileria equi strain WA]AFZ79643.1 flavoprotein domain containing protein [Theileria equi strain WA]|eukprot:XP_004829309.1 flavoprotein domain containing protein [Theileria equi strain WA]